MNFLRRFALFLMVLGPIKGYGAILYWWDLYGYGKKIRAEQIARIYEENRAKGLVSPHYYVKYDYSLRPQELVTDKIRVYLEQTRNYRVGKAPLFPRPLLHSNPVAGAQVPLEGVRALYPSPLRVIGRMSQPVFLYGLGGLLAYKHLDEKGLIPSAKIVAGVAGGTIVGMEILARALDANINTPFQYVRNKVSNSMIGDMHRLYKIGEEAILAGIRSTLPADLKGCAVEMSKMGFPVRIIDAETLKYLLESREFTLRPGSYSQNSWLLHRGAVSMPRAYPSRTAVIRALGFRTTATTLAAAASYQFLLNHQPALRRYYDRQMSTNKGLWEQVA